MKRFKKIYVEITNACNLDCSFCPGTLRGKRFMPAASFEMAVAKIRPFTDYIYLHVMGEPLLHPEFPEILAIAGVSGIKVNIATNGTLIGKYHDTLLKSDALRQINFSIHCSEMQRKAQIPADYIPRILNFIGECSGTREIYLVLRLWNNDLGAYDNAGIISLIKDRFGLESDFAAQMPHGKGILLARNVFLSMGKTFEWPDISRGKNDNPEGSHACGRVFCLGLRDQCAILADGTIVPCCLDKDAAIPLGNIFTDDFSQVVTSSRAREILKGFSEGRAVERLCENCGFRRRFS